MTIQIDGVFQCRMKSTRLPGKTLMPIMDKPLLYYMLERCRASKLLGKLVVATSSDKEDDPIEEFCNTHGYDVFRGSESDVLDRIYQCAVAFNMKHIARLSGDNPLIDPEVIDLILDYYARNVDRYDYVSNNHPPTFPQGQLVEVMPFYVLEKTWEKSDKPFQREHGTPYIWDNPEQFRIGNIEHSPNLHNEHRWTMDYEEDFALMREVFERIYPLKRIFSIEDVLQLLQENPQISAINSMYKDYSWMNKEKDNLRTIE